VRGLKPYYWSAKIPEPKIRQIIEYFALDLTAKKYQAGELEDPFSDLFSETIFQPLNSERENRLCLSYLLTLVLLELAPIFD
jgi:hypothetical protein